MPSPTASLSHMPKLPRAGSALPGVALPSAAGRTVRLWDYKQRQPLLLAFLHGADCPACRAWLAGLARARSQLDEARAATLIVLPEPIERLRALQAALDLPFMLLSDQARVAAARYLPAGAAGVALYAADRYGQCLDAWHGPDAGAFPALAAPLADFALAEHDDCACTLPAWAPE
ncbi:MAG TPA: redoxin domain-containing protein [Ktedonobacterales bacterium]|nr:redoxin domain-containing protein [Ktedonobacterales bacterium]